MSDNGEEALGAALAIEILLAQLFATVIFQNENYPHAWTEDNIETLKEKINRGPASPALKAYAIDSVSRVMKMSGKAIAEMESTFLSDKH